MLNTEKLIDDTLEGVTGGTIAETNKLAAKWMEANKTSKRPTTQQLSDYVADSLGYARSSVSLKLSTKSDVENQVIINGVSHPFSEVLHF